MTRSPSLRSVRRPSGQLLTELIGLAEDVIAAVRADLPPEARRQQATRLVVDHLLRTAD